MTAMRQISLAELLVVEDDHTILDFRCPSTGLLLWPLVRTVFMRFAMSDFLYGTPLDGSVSKGASASRAITTLSRSALHNLGQSIAGRTRADVCVMSNGVGNQWVEGKLLNRLSDHLALAQRDRSITVEEHFQWIWPQPRHNDRILMHAPLQAVNAIGAKLLVRTRHQRQAANLVTLVSQRAERLLGWRPGASREQTLTQMLARKIAGSAMQVGNYHRMFDRIEPKVVLILAGCYGSSSALITAAKRRGIITAEYQHGVISPGHDGYNFAPTVASSTDLRAALPEYFLSYGTWWNDRINAPVKMIPIGNPHRDYRVSQSRRIERNGHTKDSKDRILILSDGTEFGIYLGLAQQLEPQAAKLGLRIVIRPHPLERQSVAIKYGKTLGPIEIDRQDDLYASLMNSRAVVSELSTGLFEAVGLADKLFVWDTPKARFGFPTFPFPSFLSATDLIEKLADEKAGSLPASQIDAIWAEGWQRRYGEFLHSCGVQEAAISD